MIRTMGGTAADRHGSAVALYERAQSGPVAVLMLEAVAEKTGKEPLN